MEKINCIRYMCYTIIRINSFFYVCKRKTDCIKNRDIYIYKIFSETAQTSENIPPW